MNSSMTAGHLVITMIAALERQEVPSVYLRNYESLPAEVGNDVDLLVPAGKRGTVAKILASVADEHGWIYLGCGHFSPLAVYFANPETAETLHLDLFDRVEWHFVEFADAAKILARRQFNGMVHIPAAEDEVYLNLATRLIYQGKIRAKHQAQARTHVDRRGEGSLIPVFGDHLGKPGEAIARDLATHQWQASPMIRRALLHAALVKYGVRRPWQALTGATRYGWRILRKTIRPPGRLIVIEGADGVGKSTVLEEILPWCAGWCGRATYDFHWKPVRLQSGPRQASPSVDPRGTTPRPALISVIYLGFHLLGFWWGWIVRIRPLLAKSHCVVGDRYSYDLFLDPRRFRLKLPSRVCRMVALLAPTPAVTIGLVASPDAIHARKPELTLDEISAYQDRWRSLATDRRGMLTVSADGPAHEVILRVKQAILNEVTGHGAN